MARTLVHGSVVALVGMLQLAACSGSGDGSGESGLPSSFGPCKASVCEVQLSAFSKSPGTIPYCPVQQADLDLSCGSGTDVSGGTCAELYAVTIVYGFPGDNYQCLYQGGKLVGARWNPDNHQPQFAGKQLPESCSLAPLCPAPSGDAGTD